LVDGDLVTLSTLGGGLARNQPELVQKIPSSFAATQTQYTRHQAEISLALRPHGRGGCRLYRVERTANDTTDSYAIWLEEMTTHFEVTVDLKFMGQPATTLVEHFKSYITGFVT
jgi:hypothetical protein